jgi:Pyruvate/2-oxoacid:ferredoxin oxidoreductase gamma subunit
MNAYLARRSRAPHSEDQRRAEGNVVMVGCFFAMLLIVFVLAVASVLA